MEKITVKQKEYIEIICEFLDIPLPNIETKDQARKWLSEYAPIYKQESELVAISSLANYNGEVL